MTTREKEQTYQQNGHSNTHTQDMAARVYIKALLAHQKPESMPDVGKWWQVCATITRAYDANPDTIEKVINALINSNAFRGLNLKKLLSDTFDLPDFVSIDVFPPLPESAYLPPEASQNVSPCLDTYIAYSKRYSPEGHEHFHEACFLWALSTVAARRVRFPLGDDGYTPLMLVMCADTSLYKKTTTAKAAMKWLRSSSLGWFLGPKRTTPQKMVYDMAGVIPKNFNDLDKDKQEWVEKRLAFSGQRGWYTDEFGKFVKSTQNANSPMADFQGLLLEMDSCEPVYDSGTILRGTEIVDKPYLALLGSMTPTNLRMNGKTGSEFWNDGFWARFAFIYAPKGSGTDDPFTDGDIPVPPYLIERLEEWHIRLGIPEARVEPVIENEKDTGRLNVRKDDLPETTCVLGKGVRDAWVRYRSALKSIINSKGWNMTDLNGNYDRLPTKAIRVAALLASLENNGVIEMKYWAKAQEIIERWRRGLHELYTQVNEGTGAIKNSVELEIMRKIYELESEKGIHPTVADLQNASNRLKHEQAATIHKTLKVLVETGVLDKEGKNRYSLAAADRKDRNL